MEPHELSADFVTRYSQLINAVKKALEQKWRERVWAHRLPDGRLDKIHPYKAPIPINHRCTPSCFGPQTTSEYVSFCPISGLVHMCHEKCKFVITDRNGRCCGLTGLGLGVVLDTRGMYDYDYTAMDREMDGEGDTGGSGCGGGGGGGGGDKARRSMMPPSLPPQQQLFGIDRHGERQGVEAQVTEVVNELRKAGKIHVNNPAKLHAIVECCTITWSYLSKWFRNAAFEVHRATNKKCADATYKCDLHAMVTISFLDRGYFNADKHIQFIYPAACVDLGNETVVNVLRRTSRPSLQHGHYTKTEKMFKLLVRTLPDTAYEEMVANIRKVDHVLERKQDERYSIKPYADLSHLSKSQLLRDQVSMTASSPSSLMISRSDDDGDDENRGFDGTVTVTGGISDMLTATDEMTEIISLTASHKKRRGAVTCETVFMNSVM